MPVKRNLKSELWNINSRAARYNKAARSAALLFERDVKLKITLSRPSGRVYRRFGRLHIASAPGQPPAIDTGRLINSISSFRIATGHYRVGTAVNYAAALDNVRKKNRPFFAVTFKKNKQKYLGEMRRQLKAR